MWAAAQVTHKERHKAFLVEGPRTRALAAREGVPCWRQELFNMGPSLRRNRGARGKGRGAQKECLCQQTRAGSCPELPIPSYGGQAKARTSTESPSRFWSPPQDSGQERGRDSYPGGRQCRPGARLSAGDSGLTWGLNCSRRRCGGRQRPDCSRDPREAPRETP